MGVGVGGGVETSVPLSLHTGIPISLMRIGCRTVDIIILVIAVGVALMLLLLLLPATRWEMYGHRTWR